MNEFKNGVPNATRPANFIESAIDRIGTAIDQVQGARNRAYGIADSLFGGVQEATGPRDMQAMDSVAPGLSNVLLDRLCTLDREIASLHVQLDRLKGL